MRLTLLMTFILATAVIPVSAGAGNQQTAAVEKAAPYVEAAITRPLTALYASAQKHEANDMMTMGLALLSGRVTDGDFSASDRAALGDLDARITAPVEVYLAAHPNENHARVNWRKKLQITMAERELVERYQAAYLPEYWLGLAFNQARDLRQTQFLRPTTSDVRSGIYTAGGSISGYTRLRIIDAIVLTTAAHCVHAVRKAAGLPLQPLDQHPLSIQLFRSYLDLDIQAVLDKQLNDPASSASLKGAAACGTTAQFDIYVAKLKSSAQF